MDSIIELEVTAGTAEGQFTVRVVRAVAGGESTATMHLDAEAYLGARDDLETVVLASASAGRRVLSPGEQRLRDVGQQLFEALFCGPIEATYRASADAADGRGERLRVVLRLDVPVLAGIPWEAMYDAQNDEYICLNDPLVRHIPSTTAEPLEIASSLEVLAVVASPDGLTVLDVEAERKKLFDALAEPIDDGRIHLKWLTQASWEEVQDEMLSSTWHVVHFIGHGDYDLSSDQGVIALVGDDGGPHLVEADRLAELLKQATPTPRLVVLNSCQTGRSGARDLFSSTAATLVRRGIDAVAAMQFSVSDAGAKKFARGFYSALASGHGIGEAIGAGRVGLLGTPGSLEWVTPVLYVRSDTANLFRITSTPRPAAPPATRQPAEPYAATQEEPSSDPRRESPHLGQLSSSATSNRSEEAAQLIQACAGDSGAMKEDAPEPDPLSRSDAKTTLSEPPPASAAATLPPQAEEPSRAARRSNVGRHAQRLLRQMLARGPLVPLLAVTGVLAVTVAIVLGVFLWRDSGTNLPEGEPASAIADPFQVAETSTDGPTGLRPGAPYSTRTVVGGDGGEVDRLAAMSVSDIEKFWDSAYAEPLTGKFIPVNALVSWDSNGNNERFCDGDTLGVINAGFCAVDNTIGWDRGVLLPSLRVEFRDLAVTLVMAHEYAHSIQSQSELWGPDTPRVVAEQQADCFAGVYMRWVAVGKSPRFTLNTGDGLSNVLAAMIAFRDPIPRENEVPEHQQGTAFERISAFQSGFNDGVSSCVLIEKEQRPLALPMQRSELPVSEESVRSVIDALKDRLSPPNPPELSFDPESCSDARETSPVSYCPSTNTIAVYKPGLEKMGTSTGGNQTLQPSGDYSAYSFLTSRFMLAVQHQQGLALHGDAAALRTACLTGVATMELTTSRGGPLELTIDDIDEAVSGLLTNGLAASDVNGKIFPRGYPRIDAFRLGVFGDQPRCVQHYP